MEMDNNSEYHDQFLFDNDSDHNDNAWQTVSRRKKNKRRPKSKSPEILSDRHDSMAEVTGDSVCSSVQHHSEDVRQEIIASQSPSVDDAGSPVNEDGNGKIKKLKVIKPKTPKIMMAETAAKMDVDHLEAYLIDIAETVINERQQLMRFADYFGKALSSIN